MAHFSSKRIVFTDADRRKRARGWMERHLALEQDLLGEDIISNVVLDSIAAAQTLEKLFSATSAAGSKTSRKKARAARKNLNGKAGAPTGNQNARKR